jgi:hypothetical protein
VANTDRKRHSETLGTILSYLVSMTTILGIPVALYGYLSAQQSSRVDRTFEFYKDFRAADLQDDVNLLVEKFNGKADEVSKFLANNDEAGLTELEKTLLQDAKANAALSRVVVFYDAVGPCVAHSLCDADATVALLKFQAQQMVSAYGAYVVSQQQPQSPFGSGIFIVNGLTAPAKSWPWPWSARSTN